MATIGSTATAKVIARITAGGTAASEGMAAEVVGAGGAEAAAQVLTQNVAADLAEKSAAIRYPVAQVYCEKIVNSLAEKFRTFSGTVQMAIELRQSSDRLEGLQSALEAVADAITRILSASRGDWGGGMYYAGAYQVAFGPAKHGGKNFIQAAKVTFEIGVSIS